MCDESPTILRHLTRLEHRAGSPVSSVVVLAGLWPDTPERWAEIQADHPQGRLFVPAPLTPEAWEAIAPREQAANYADPYALHNA
jgi:hypothetical protein